MNIFLQLILRPMNIFGYSFIRKNNIRYTLLLNSGNFSPTIAAGGSKILEKLSDQFSWRFSSFLFVFTPTLMFCV
jgi:hypothetical protein